ncbi:DoxX family protein [Streptomyces meridianus]|uniref:DoxX family protein n=1 Tax=Streptomyces meridianus TaxID=2938945 RepID=A0ABT0X8I2_9ACTN|nr:DoxX family protein [Streptomyces meridianus]MCM2578729.1 DoxX family protein [Streptomyces meridianus]
MSLSETLVPLAEGPPAEPDAPKRRAHDAGLLVLRLAVGALFAVHGAQKLVGWFGGAGLDGTGHFFEKAGYPAGRTMAAVAGACELAGGVGLILGLFMPFAAAALVGVMINAVAVKWSGGFFAPSGIEFEATLLAVTTALTLAGPGRIATDHVLPGLRNHRLARGIWLLVLAVLVAGALLVIRSQGILQ